MERHGIAPIPEDSPDGQRMEHEAENACLREALADNKTMTKPELQKCTEDKIREMMSGKMY